MNLHKRPTYKSLLGNQLMPSENSPTNKKMKEKLAKILNNQYIPSQYVLPFDQNTFPIHVKNDYKEYKSHVLEIGSGWGEFTLGLAEKFQNQFIFAVEKKKKRVIRSEKLQRQKSLLNIRWMVLDVSWFFDKIFLEQSFDKIIINFPDPWPKKKHRKHRFMNESLINSLTIITNNSAIMEFVTDSWSYIQESVGYLEKSPHWKNKHGKGVVLREFSGRITSFYGDLQKKDGKNIYYLEYEKIT